MTLFTLSNHAVLQSASLHSCTMDSSWYCAFLVNHKEAVHLGTAPAVVCTTTPN